MASIYKRGRIWWIAYRDRAGQRIQKSTRLKDEASAKRIKKHYDAVEKSYVLIGTPLQRSIRLDGWKRQYLERRAGRVAPGTLARDRQAIESLEKQLKNPFLSQITPPDIERWYSANLKNRATATANCLYRHCKTFFNMAVEERYLPESPCRVRPVKEVTRELRPLTKEQVSALLAILPETWKNLTTTALYTGARAGELCRLKIADIDLSVPVVTITSTSERPTKNKQFRTVPIPEYAVHFFEKLMAGREPKDHLLKNKKGEPWNVKWLSKGFRRWTKKAGIDCTFHDLRRTYGAWLVMAGVDLVTVKENLGHSSITVTVKHYTHLLMDHRAEQVNRLPHFM